MGNCCSWKTDLEGVGEMQMKSQKIPFDNLPHILNHERSSNMFKISTFLTNKEDIPDFFLKQEIFYKNINDAILNTNNSKIDTINIESLWNISKYYKQDFTNCPYILYDLRKKENKVENFLKKYKCINYNIGEIKTFNGNRLKLFKNFIRNKNIIIIPQNQSISELKKISNFIESLSGEIVNNQKYFILTDILNIKDEDIPEFFYNYKLYKKFDDKDFEYYPNIFFPLSNIKYLNNFNYIYIQQKEYESNFYITNKDFLNFCKNMGIKIILDLDDIHENQEKPEIIKINSDEEDENEISENNKESDISTLKPKYNKGNNKANESILYFTINYKDYFNTESLKLFLYNLRYHFLSQSTLVILYPEKINDKKELSKWLSYILINSFFIYDGDDTMLTESEILTKSIQGILPLYFSPKFIEDDLISDIEENYSSKDYNSEPYNAKLNEFIQGVKNLWDIKKEKNIFFEIICVIEKLILNIILNPGNEKYYKIRKSSRTLQNYIINIPEANNLFQMIGFKNQDKGEFYSVDTKVNIKQMENIHKLLLFSVNKIINESDY
jgi:hypothetical protein